jgi:DNA-binding MarR family transcriptional regulator
MAQGYLQRKRSKEDARTNAIRLTPVGKKMLRASQSGAEDIDRKLLSHFSAADRRVVMECLAGLAQEMDKIDEAAAEDDTPPAKIKLKRKPFV